MPENSKTQYWLNLFFTIGISLIWLINGLFCKILNLVPRHQLIVSRILGSGHSYFFTKAIGVAELLMFFWIISRKMSRLCVLTQVIVIATMNIIEFILAPDLLLFGQVNILLAAVLIIVILINEFLLTKPKPT